MKNSQRTRMIMINREATSWIPRNVNFVKSKSDRKMPFVIIISVIITLNSSQNPISFSVVYCNQIMIEINLDSSISVLHNITVFSIILRIIWGINFFIITGNNVDIRLSFVNIIDCMKRRSRYFNSLE